MPTETITVAGRPVETLAELLRPGLRAVVVGINPSPVSVAKGHYFQGQLGRRLWSRLQEGGILSHLSPGAEDDDAFAQGIGFADLLRRPTPNADDIDDAELKTCVPSLEERLARVGVKTLLFVFKRAHDIVAPHFRDTYKLILLPGPYAPREEVSRALKLVREALGIAPLSKT